MRRRRRGRKGEEEEREGRKGRGRGSDGWERGGMEERKWKREGKCEYMKTRKCEIEQFCLLQYVYGLREGARKYNRVSEYGILFFKMNFPLIILLLKWQIQNIIFWKLNTKYQISNNKYKIQVLNIKTKCKILQNFILFNIRIEYRFILYIV